MRTNAEDLDTRIATAAAECDDLPVPPTLPDVVPPSRPDDADTNDGDTDASVDGDIKSDVGGVTVALTKFDLPSGSQNAPFDPTKNWTLGPQQWNYKYSSAKKFWHIQ
jgi:hypothetical protein